MRLSSNLFYNSTVVSKSDSKLHPRTFYPLHFVCTSLQDGTFQNISDIHNDEADVVLSEVKKFTEVWPKQWGKREKSSVCVVAASRNQVCKFKFILAIYMYKDNIHSNALLYDILKWLSTKPMFILH